MTQYQTKIFREDVAGTAEEPAPLDKLYAKVAASSPRESERLAAQVTAKEAIEDFVAFCRRFLQEHPPETHIMLAQGFGVRLAGGYDVSLTPPMYENLGGQLETTATYPVTMGMGSPGMRGIEPSMVVPVTGTQPHPGLRGPGA